MTHQGTGINSTDADDSLLLHLLRQGTGGAPVGNTAGKVTDNQAGNPNLVAVGLAVLIVPARITNLGRGGNHDLTVIRRVSHGLLVASHGGSKDGLAQGCARGAEAEATESTAIGEDQDGGSGASGSHCALNLSVILSVKGWLCWL